MLSKVGKPGWLVMAVYGHYLQNMGNQHNQNLEGLGNPYLSF